MSFDKIVIRYMFKKALWKAIDKILLFAHKPVFLITSEKTSTPASFYLLKRYLVEHLDIEVSQAPNMAFISASTRAYIDGDEVKCNIYYPLLDRNVLQFSQMFPNFMEVLLNKGLEPIDADLIKSAK
jgi:hypothetical protein